MLDQLMNVLRQRGLDSVINNPKVPDEHNEGVLQEAQGSIIAVIRDMMAKGQTEELRQLAADPAHPATQQMQQGFMDAVMQKFGISGATAQGIAAALIPAVLAALDKRKTAPSGTGMDMGALMGTLGKAGLDKDGNGTIDLKDIKSMLGF